MHAKRRDKGVQMNKAKRLKLVNVLLILFLAYQAVTGMVLGTIGGDVLGVLHPIGGGVLVVLACIHIGLNWGWVRTAFSAKK
jgi:heme A synthase